MKRPTTHNDLVCAILDRFQSAIDNECDQLHDMGWDDYAEAMELDLSAFPNDPTVRDECFDDALRLQTSAFDEIRDQLTKREADDEEDDPK